MSLSWLLTYLGGAFLWAVVVCLALAGLARLSGWRSPTRCMWAALWVLCFFVVLTHYPLPDWNTFTCPNPAMTPNWTAFNFITHFQTQYAQSGHLWGAIWDKTFLSMGMNFAICAAAGAALIAARMPRAIVLCIGLILPILIETSQLTGVFGLTPCPYRQFDINDIILNTAGVSVAALMIWLFQARHR